MKIKQEKDDKFETKCFEVFERSFWLIQAFMFKTTHSKVCVNLLWLIFEKPRRIENNVAYRQLEKILQCKHIYFLRLMTRLKVTHMLYFFIVV
jgi:hypothetical protein